tara:strand:+ start:1942 stop:2121 length:180 start_codon:yes stop_codon:yes gene_type:complete
MMEGKKSVTGNEELKTIKFDDITETSQVKDIEKMKVLIAIVNNIKIMHSFINDHFVVSE